MAGITLAQAETQLAAWLAADTAVMDGQEFELNVNGVLRRVKLSDAAIIARNIDIWDKRCKQLSRGGISVRRGAPA